MTALPAPFPPLVLGGDGLDRHPTPPEALRARMAQVYGVPESHVLPVRGVTHGLELVWRMAARDGQAVQAPGGALYDTVASLYAKPGAHAPIGAIIVRGSDDLPSAVSDGDQLLVVDDGDAEFADCRSVAELLNGRPRLVLLRSLSLAYGLAGARVGAAIGRPQALARLAAVLEPHALPSPSVQLALQALEPSRLLETAERITATRLERERLRAALIEHVPASAGRGPFLDVRPPDVGGVTLALARLGVPFAVEDDRLKLPVFARPELNDRLLTAFGVSCGGRRPNRTGEAIRDTKETRIVCVVDLDAAGPVQIQTGVGFFDHMLEQVAAHGGFSLRLACEGDLHIDPHHTVEDCAIALGQALRRALGDRRGIARYGFVLPMDEAEAKVSLDLSGRPFPVFEGSFSTPFIGDYRTDLTAHVFRSLAEHLRAAVHVSVTGDDDHHKTEAVYKAFGRALRQAIRVEGEAVPSTKGVL